MQNVELDITKKGFVQYSLCTKIRAFATIKAGNIWLNEFYCLSWVYVLQT